MVRLKLGSRTIETEPKDIIFPLIYIALLFVLGFFIWKLVSPFLSLAVSGIILYLYSLRDIFKKKSN